MGAETGSRSLERQLLKTICALAPEDRWVAEANTDQNSRSAIMAASANTNLVNRSIARSVFRWIHIVLAIPILGYIYSPFDKLPSYAFRTRFIFVPIMVLSGLWMWKGHVVRRLLSRRQMAGRGSYAA